ncbi:ammonia-dependent NAD(+) synthetase [Sporosarcina sp. BI001-red]|uniref:ammonia-dependent NAD(+) synthetase n=1 Tax=Sporosarcina sp. BI001-red TaxID=2282866 RepID=UPI000E27A8F0|nr:ammonia-dependent NAD(+) synthetase [Sporosarcina sp. BI001-red]REB05640.1 ammonia-dependent NAD(+) synthetase [Sporosarcina sp. BI001-red]
MNELQQQVIHELHVQPEIDPQKEVRVSVDFLKAYLVGNKFLEGYVLGISGGQDSTLAGKLGQMAVDELNKELATDRYKFVAVRLPYGTQFDEEDCQDALRFINPTLTYTVNIKGAVDASRLALDTAEISLTDFEKGNEKARERMKVQFSMAAFHHCAVIGTDHAAEAITGFFTKFGDGAADVTPLSRLNKRQGKEMLEFLGCPEHLYNKVPTADLEEDKPALPDEVALGVTYTQIDDYLEGKQVPDDVRQTIERHYLRSEHKRHLPITVFDNFWK